MAAQPQVEPAQVAPPEVLPDQEERALAVAQAVQPEAPAEQVALLAHPTAVRAPAQTEAQQKQALIRLAILPEPAVHPTAVAARAAPLAAAPAQVAPAEALPELAHLAAALVRLAPLAVQVTPAERLAAVLVLAHPAAHLAVVQATRLAQALEQLAILLGQVHLAQAALVLAHPAAAQIRAAPAEVLPDQATKALAERARAVASKTAPAQMRHVAHYA